MFKGVNNCPIDVINADRADEGFYKDLSQNDAIFYLSKKNGSWYMQYPLNSRPILMEGSFPRRIIAQRIEPEQYLETIQQHKRFIESKLAKMARKK